MVFGLRVFSAPLSNLGFGLIVGFFLEACRVFSPLISSAWFDFCFRSGSASGKLSWALPVHIVRQNPPKIDVNLEVSGGSQICQKGL
ncbi:unnamed protein product [Linum tenue]|uniref:Uncharacterized protein n=1 Tax=Linum tenue TaxID=586396 RepID=A0AAV0I0X7_9ROSI|nr:unnamed protein product [Linum tenue]